MPRIYVTEAVMHNGNSFLPGEAIDGDENDIAAILSAGRGTLDADVGAQAKKSYFATQKAVQASADAQVKLTNDALAAAIAPALAAAIASAAAQ